MAKKSINVSVNLKESRGNIDKMIRRFIKKAKKANIVEQARERRYYKKPSIKKKEKRRRAIRAAVREKQKRLKAQERRNRKR